MDINNGPDTLKKLFNGDAVIEVPNFQRNYVWKNENVKQVLIDAEVAGQSGDNHFFGPIVLLSKSDGYEVIDGQQRVTTAVMAVAVLRDILLEKRYFPDSEEAFRNSTFHSIKSFLFTGSVPPQPKFFAGYLIRRVFSAAILPDPSDRSEEIQPKGAGLSKQETEDTRELRRVYLFIEKHLSAKFEPIVVEKRKELFLQLFKGLTERFQIHSMVVNKELDAYLLFESINYLGIKLAPEDLLKSLILRRIQSHTPAKLKESLTKWDTFTANLSGYPVTKFLRHYMLTKEKTDVRASKIFTAFKEQIVKTDDGAEVTLKELDAASKQYKYLLAQDPAYRHPSATIQGVAERLNIIGDTHRVLLLMILQSNLSTPQKEQAFRAAEYLVFRTVCARENAQETQDLYQTLGHKLKATTTQAELDAWCLEVTSGVLTDQKLKEHVVANCPKAGIQYDPREDLARYALAVIHAEKGMGWNFESTLEHLAPQTPSDGSNWRSIATATKPYDTIVHWWGNLTLLEKPLNSSIGNREWAIKLDGIAGKPHPGLKASGYLLTKQVVKRSKWQLDEIESRGDWMIDTLLGYRSVDWVATGTYNGPAVTLW
jgi:hypothetical protein